jgi:hypothetical protein
MQNLCGQSTSLHLGGQHQTSNIIERWGEKSRGYFCSVGVIVLE